MSDCEFIPQDRSNFATMWTDAAVSLMLEEVQTRESIWNFKNPLYRDQQRKRADYEELMMVLSSDVPGLTLTQLKGKIQGIRSVFREEIKKVRKSRANDRGVGEVYISKWKFFDECMFLEEILWLTNHNYGPGGGPPGGMHEDSNSPTQQVEHQGPPLEERAYIDSYNVTATNTDQTNVSEPRIQKKTTHYWSDAPSSSMATPMSVDNSLEREDEWDIFGKDVAHSLRKMATAEQKRRLKFAIQSTIFNFQETNDLYQTSINGQTVTVTPAGTAPNVPRDT